ncbi:MAG TPA: hypothetical protein VGA82_01550 [Dehalococcoidales bacterium]
MTEVIPSSEEPAPESEKAIMPRLSKPSRELSSRLLSQVSFNDRVLGVRSHPSGGQNWDAIYSFQEATQFMGVVGDSIYHIDSDTLKKWIGDTLGDKELAQAIGETAKVLDSCADSWEREKKELELIVPMRELMEERLRQAREVLG